MEFILSTDALDSSQDVNDLLTTMENAVMLIGPQLKHNRTRLDTTKTGKHAQGQSSEPPHTLLTGPVNSAISDVLSNQVEAEIAVQRGMTRPTGPVHLRTENATVDTDWTTASGTGSYAGRGPLPAGQPVNVG